jgi:hypothetical protein
MASHKVVFAGLRKARLSASMHRMKTDKKCEQRAQVLVMEALSRAGTFFDIWPIVRALSLAISTLLRSNLSFSRCVAPNSAQPLASALITKVHICDTIRGDARMSLRLSGRCLHG